ncbi:MAG: dipeptide ABC transporter ATP-binding protein [Chloroflexi bacterium AL-W]|nr:dipeptide ABC transporter ATP-binding protein [Chloroflexi bacterium AL-N1]NOK68775.1 dipeptide ABC transporter ATP-binding protein [Chloroflexi bacterium AL-N10]NOK76261.1 dipeptide ABC transporter ATP-binding protein [Chloroflexi bacterium AL-N5]NOK84102.1 dipeptide ABC transporter ATP-binding protein [Chloroflexi bacterium AL-W]NOK91399.1 dipeptide ABC transporter ATP-binding protein [Chloroflexi bacterium AL-N15]
MENQQTQDDSTLVLEVEDLAIAYKVRGGEIEAVQNVSFDIQRGETHGIVGESGCGKSTVAWAILNFLGANGFVKRGSIKFQGQDLVGKQGEELRRLRGDKIAMVYQDPMQALNPSLRLGEQMKEVLTVHRNMSSDDAEEQCVEMLKRVYMPDPSSVMRRYPHQISGGQQQRVVIAMALLNNPALLIMDEPTTALDVTVEAAVLDLIAELRRDFDTAIMYISHNLGVVARVCSRVGVMYAGEMVERATVEDIFDHPQHPYTQGLIRCVPKLGNNKDESQLYPIPGRVPPPNDRPKGCVYGPRCDYTQDRCIAERPQLRSVANNTQVRCHFAEEIDQSAWIPPEDIKVRAATEDVTQNEPILQINSLKKYYDVAGNGLRDVIGLGEKRQVKAVEDISFDVPRGSTLGIVGESGCGKSTLVKTIIGLEDSTDGEANFLGFDITGDLSQRNIDLIQELQMVFQNPDSTMNPSYTVGQQIARPMIRFKTVPRNQIRENVVKLLDSIRLSESYYDRLPRQLSGGEKQRVGIARALASQPDLVLCDEPVSALDVSVQAAILNLLIDIQREFGTTMIFIAHDLSVVRFFSDYVAVMYLGNIVEIGRAEDIYAPPYHPYTEALLSAVPIPDPKVEQKQIRLDGAVPSAMKPPSGCRFHTRCPRRDLMPDGGKKCETDIPPWREFGDGHQIFCHLPQETLETIDPVIKSPSTNGSSNGHKKSLNGRTNVADQQQATKS